MLTKGIASPKLIVLNNGTELETKYAKFFRNAVQQRIADQYSYDQFWSKIDPLVAGKKMLYVSPDGVFNQININTLRKKGGDYLENRFDIVVVGNAKDVLTLKTRKPVTKKDAFVLGFPDYAGAAVALPGTKVEIDAVGRILKTAGYKVDQREKTAATEASLKAVQGPTIIHIATHGYFLADANLGEGTAMGVNAESAKNNPLLRSRLMISALAPATRKARCNP